MLVVQIYFVTVFAVIAAATDPHLHHIVTRALEDATEWHQRNFGNASGATARGSGCPYAAAKSTPIAEQSHGFARSWAIDAVGSLLPPICQGDPSIIPCNWGSKYRTQDGTCNNLRNPMWGAANTPFIRLVTAGYEDGEDEPRGGQTFSRLPNAREVSNVVHSANNVNHPTITHMLPMVGQFVDHDLTSTAAVNRDCCFTGFLFSDCWAINIPFFDTFYSKHSQRCMDFTRSTAYCFRPNGVREQMNTITAYLDCSMIYGSDTAKTSQLRSFVGGRLRTNDILSEFLPVTSGDGFIAGDERVNENPGLTAIQNLFLMEHNRVADQIAANRRWSDETIFQEARRIVIAEFQQIVYNEYLPAVLGPETMFSHDLALSGTRRSQYRDTINPTIYNSFATAAYRFGHSLVGGNNLLVNRKGKAMGSFKLRDNFLAEGNSQLTQSSGQGYEWVIGGLLAQTMEESDAHCTDDLRNFLFKASGKNFGGDLIARNIQRGRDHGLPSYNEFRKACDLPELTSWSSRPAEISDSTWSLLQRSPFDSPLYSSPREIDLFTGGLMETPVVGGITGPTFNCIKAKQFRNLKFGDRFFFTHEFFHSGFTDEQVRQLTKRTLGDLICENGKQFQTQRNVFFVESASNPSVRCGDGSRAKLDITRFLL